MALGIAMFALAAPAADAAVALSWTGGTFLPSVHQQTVGWSFTADQPASVTALDWYDPAGDNTAQHDVTIWTGDGAQVAAACVGLGCSGSSYSAADGYWSTPLKLSLAAGSYVIGGYVGIGDPFAYNTATRMTAPNITYGTGLYTLGASTAMPTVACCGSIVGPNLEIAGVPEPASWALMLVGFASLGAAVRGRRQFLPVAG